MNDSSWVTRLLPIQIPDKIFNFNVKFKADEMMKNNLFDIDVVINDKFDDFMKFVFEGSVEKAQKILGHQNYSIVKYQLMDVAFTSILQSYYYASEDIMFNQDYTKDQDLNMYFTMIKLESKSPITDEIETHYYKIFGINLPLFESKGNYTTYHQLGGFMSPAQDIIVVNTTGQDNTCQLYHEVLHAVIRELRRTLDNEMYGDTEADQREEIIVHFMTDKPDTVHNLQQSLSSLNLVKSSDGLVQGVKLSPSSKFVKTTTKNDIRYRATSQLNSITQKCKSIRLAKPEVKAKRIANFRAQLVRDAEHLTVNEEVRGKMLDVVKKLDKLSSLNRFLKRARR